MIFVIYGWFIVLYMNRFALSSSFISQEALLFPLSKIVGAYLQNISWGMFLFRLWIGIVYHGENFLMIRISNSRIEQNLGSTEMQ